MQNVIVKNQVDWDNLPQKFKILTLIEIISEGKNTIKILENPSNSRVVLYDNSRVVLYSNSRAELYDNSRAEFYGSSSAELYDNSSVRLFENSSVRLFGNSSAKIYDNSTAINFSKDTNIETFDLAKQVDQIEMAVVSFETWLERGMVVCDGIYRKLVSHKKIGEVSIYETDKGYVTKIGNKTAHGKTIEEAKNDLRYKISDRDTSEYSSWNIDDIKKTDDLIEAYRKITGACSMGTKEFCDNLQLKEKYSIVEVIDITKGKEGNNLFESFFQKQA